MVNWEHGDLGGVVLRIGPKDAAIVWNAAESKWEIAIPRPRSSDDEVADEIVALAAAMIMLNSEEGRQELVDRFKEEQ